MLCAEDEIGLGKDHAGILVLPANLRPGIALADWLKPYTDFNFEIGLTPNHMDAMNHFGVARDVRAWLSHQDKRLSCKNNLPFPGIAEQAGTRNESGTGKQKGLPPVFGYNDDRYPHYGLPKMDAGQIKIHRHPAD